MCSKRMIRPLLLIFISQECGVKNGVIRHAVRTLVRTETDGVRTNEVSLHVHGENLTNLALMSSLTKN